MSATTATGPKAGEVGRTVRPCRALWEGLCAQVAPSRGREGQEPARHHASQPPQYAKDVTRGESPRRGHDQLFDRIAGAVHAFGGEVLKFIGDGVLAIFPVVGGTPRSACDAALRAVSATRIGMAHLDEQRIRQGLPALPFGAALHLGEILWGNIGAADRLDFTAIGPAVNLVSRLEGLCKPLRKTILVSGTLAAETEMPPVALGTHALRGIASPCLVFTLPEN